jgi:hypothetical protein
LRGLWALSTSVSGLALDIQELLIVSDVWIALSLAKKPVISPADYNPGERKSQSFEQAFHGVEDQSRPTHIHNGHENQSGLSPHCFDLLNAASEIVETKELMPRISEPALLRKAIWWMHRRATATTGMLTTHCVDAGGESRSSEGYVGSLLDAAACLAGVLFMNLRFVDSPCNYNFSKPFLAMQPLLRKISKQIWDGIWRGQQKAYLWLVFMCALGYDFYSARGDVSYSNWPATEFHQTCHRLHITDERHITTVLQNFQYYDQMNDFKVALISRAGASSDNHLLSWDKWCSILGHYVPRQG